MSRTREEILKKHGRTISGPALRAMDEYMREGCLELLEYMAKNRIICSHDENGAYFLVGGEALSKDQIFENFL